MIRVISEENNVNVNITDTGSASTSRRDEDVESLFEEVCLTKKDSVFKKFFDIVKEKVFMFSCISITTLLFISTAIIFWAPDYALNVLKGDHNLVLTGFVGIALSGPVLGIILGGAVVERYAGGYEGKNSIYFALGFACLAFISALPFRFIDRIEFFGACLWAVLFFGGCIIPNLQGIMISSLKSDLRATGNSVSNVLQNALGFLPAPFLYGFIFERTKNTDPKAAMQITLLYSSVGVCFMIAALYYRNIVNKSQFEEIEEIEFEQNDKRNEDKLRIGSKKSLRIEVEVENEKNKKEVVSLTKNES